ncbi:MAG: molybdate ABC transporter substrate-binding protein [Marinobacter sp.]|uniref:molybdate ABC transporter substrate-binding protein n=1 Tax=Marinobacter sp. TaxID=50741 RepID=UPI00299D125C|nr:molybdate ABC transporter substrate-binding protein [Marinobacter sp.]MDX1756411.1 molybdate ABC transporter substrate-binding protein [Marinobacter sp.]
MTRLALPLLTTLLLMLVATGARAGEVLVAVAANFTDPARQLAERFEAQTGHRARLSFGSTGKLYAQIVHGAPFEVLLAADSRHPAMIEERGLAVAGTRFTYARGQLVLWSPLPELFQDGETYLAASGSAPLAIANPRTAPYGLAARQVLEHLHRWPAMQDRLVRGDSIAQTFQFVATGNAEAGLVALSQVRAWPDQTGSLWPVPTGYHQPIAQQAVLLTRGEDNPAAYAWLAFLRSDSGRAQIRHFGYHLDASGQGAER